jgi:hypothetical protein
MAQKMRNERALNPAYVLDDETYESLSGQIQAAYVKLDQTRCHLLRLEANFLETAEAIRLRPELTQKLILKSEQMLDSMTTSRAGLISYHTTATAIRMQTNQAVRGSGTYTPRGENSTPELRSVA